MEKLKHFSLFSGIESFKKALTNLGIDNELVGYSEFDKHASVALLAIHGVSEELNYGDITKIDETKVPDCDLITYGFPCQDISIAGLGKGIVEGETRSGLLYDALRIIKYKKPKYAIAENVKNLVGKKFKEDFEGLLSELESYGYNNYWKVLNSKDYGIPQNRERVFVVSIRQDIDNGKFEFPKPYDSGLRLKDLLEDEVEDKYYIENDRTNILLSKLKESDFSKTPKNEVLNCIKGKSENGWHYEQEVYDVQGITRALKAGGGSGNIPKVVVEPILIGGMQKNQSIKTDGISTTLVSAMGTGGGYVPMIVTNYRIRKLTPKECWRLMGFTDEDYHKARQALEERFYNGRDRSNSQMYKMAGNSIVVDVLEGILKNLLGGF